MKVIYLLYAIAFCFSLGLVNVVSGGTKVIELSDRFIELRGESTWMIKFYAPWCGHCKKLEPVWSHVAQALYNTDIRVGRVDCTRFTAMATEFKIKGFPTIMFVKGSTIHTFRGDRTKEELIGFALRMVGAPVPHLDKSHLEQRLREHDLFFLFIGPREGKLWESYYSHAMEYRHFHYFFSSDLTAVENVVEKPSEPSVYVFKEKSYVEYSRAFKSYDLVKFCKKVKSANFMLIYLIRCLLIVPETVESDDTKLNASLLTWINNERFPIFMKFTHGNFPQLWKVDKFLAIVVVQENKIGSLTSDEVDGSRLDSYKFRDMIKAVTFENQEKYSSHFQFGWTGTPDLANSIAMERLSLPSFLVVNTASMIHYLPQQDSDKITEESLKAFLDSILDKTAPTLGGDSYLLRAYRIYYNTKSSLKEMWAGNSVLTAVLFGLPLGFLSLICYSIWCSDILDADEEEVEREKPHEKKD